MSKATISTKVHRKALTRGDQAIKPFWQSVRELAAMRVHIPEDRRALSGVRHVLLKTTKRR